jgi:hypothetical protein
LPIAGPFFAAAGFSGKLIGTEDLDGKQLSITKGHPVKKQVLFLPDGALQADAGRVTGTNQALVLCPETA